MKKNRNVGVIKREEIRGDDLFKCFIFMWSNILLESRRG